MHDIPPLWEIHDLYQLMGVQSAASDAEIRRAIRGKLHEWHPDRHRDKEKEARDWYAALTKAALEAKRVLLDPVERKHYDRFRGAHGSGHSGGFDSGGWKDDQRSDEGQRRERYTGSQNHHSYSKDDRSTGSNDRHRYESTGSGEPGWNEHGGSGKRDDQHWQRQGRDSRRDNSSEYESSDYGRTKEEPARTKSSENSAEQWSKFDIVGTVLCVVAALAILGAIVYGIILAIPIIVEFLIQVFTFLAGVALIAGVGYAIVKMNER